MHAMAAKKHEQIREWIQDEIRQGHYVEGDQLPTEQALMAQFGVSRAPVQQAMRALELNGVVVRRPGAGTFVSVWGLRTDVRSALAGEQEQPAEHTSYRVLATRTTSAAALEWAATVFGPQHPVAVLTRLKVHTTGRPIALEQAVISLVHVPEILDQDLETLSTQDHFTRIGLPVRTLTNHLSAQLLNPEDAAHLEIDPTVPVIRQHRTVIGAGDVPYETAYFHMHPTNQLMEITRHV